VRIRLNRTKLSRREGTDQRGASAVEFALVLPIFLLLLFGIIQYGTIFLVRNQMIDAASDAARSAVTYQSIGAAVSAAQSELQQDVTRDGAGLIPINCSTAPISPNPALICNARQILAPACNAPQNYSCLQVTIKYHYTKDPVIDFPLLPTPSWLTVSSNVLIGNGALQQ